MSAPSHTNTLPTRTIPGTLIPTWTPHFKAFIYLVYHQRIWGIWWTISLLHPSVDEEKSLNRLIENWKQKKWKKRQKQDVGGQFTTENPKITLFSLAFFFPLYHIKKTQAFASVDLLLLCFWLCSFKAFSEFSLWRKHRERKQHRVSKNTSCCNCGSFSIHKSHLCFLHWNRISTCLFFVLLSGDTNTCACLEHRYQILLKSPGNYEAFVRTVLPLTTVSWVYGWPSNQPYSLIKSLQDLWLHYLYYLV